MSTEIPATFGADEVTAWSDDVDVVVIGFGIAGGCAAVDGGACVPVPCATAASGVASMIAKANTTLLHRNMTCLHRGP